MTYKWCKICGEMKQFSHTLHMIIQKRVKEDDTLIIRNYEHK